MSAAEDTKKGACVPCSSLDPSSLLSKEKVQSLLLDKLPMWTLQPKEGSTGMLSRSFTAKNFQAALNAINSMGAIAESEGHHPDFHLTNYRDVRIDLYTHSVGGITENDIVLAEQLDRVEIVYSPKWLKDQPFFF